MPRVVIATCEPLPKFDPEHAPLAEALALHDVQTEVVPWDREGYDWHGADLVVIRSTWDYHQRRDEFLRWAQSVRNLWNPFEAIRWNSHKGYLEELRAQGVPTVPTFWVKQGDRVDLREFFSDAPWTEAVAKPAVSAGAENTIRFRRDQQATAEAHVTKVSASCDVMLQPYLPSVEAYGERSFVYFGGQFSHAVRRPPMLGAQRPDELAVESSTPVPATRGELQLCAEILTKVPWPLLYARVDLAPMPDGSQVLMELELIEPSLFLRHGPSAAERLAEELRKRL